MMTPLLLSIVSPVVGVAIASLVGYLVYVNKTRITVSVELVVDTKSAPHRLKSPSQIAASHRSWLRRLEFTCQPSV